MMRSTTIGVAAILLLALASTAAPARHVHMSGSGWSGHHAHFATFHHARFRHHGPFFAGYASYAAYDYGCWRWRPTPWGWHRVWVCGYPYYDYF
jgi:hypothetical protein